MYIVFIFYCSGCIYQTILKSRDRRGGERAREIDRYRDGIQQQSILYRINHHRKHNTIWRKITSITIGRGSTSHTQKKRLEKKERKTIE